MKPETILKKAIEKAVKNGWDDLTEKKFIKDWPKQPEPIKKAFAKRIYGNLIWVPLIFSHDFAKAFWNSTSCFHGGEEYRHEYKPYNFCKAPDKQAQWQYHLQQMVIVDPIKYLEKFL